MSRIEHWSIPTEHSQKEDFRTPQYILDYIEAEFGEIELDVACFADGSNAVALPVRLRSAWPRGHAYANPPFDSDSIRAWWVACHAHASSGKGSATLLIPNKLCQVFLNPLLPLANEVIMLGGRVNFEGPYQRVGGTSRQGSVIVRFELGSTDRNPPRLRQVLLRDLKERFQ